MNIMSWHPQSHGYKYPPVYYRAQACPPPGYGMRNYHYGPSCHKPVWDRSEGMSHFYSHANGHNMYDGRVNAGAAALQMGSQGEVPFKESIEDREYMHQVGRKNPSVEAFAGIHHTRFME